ncbi:hypothetical protein O9X80_06380 [Agrobacterium salinitolerans]|uniref:hypothetical protein n=1 Tax=Agrobacterium salinitolerans TaxID=1183413 RepID=UPI0022B844E0|nr:hypothetical protein [Agrobacterium salinitolerans]MCZ7974119.1 hypothetical protein [Agrobacterium salinitolerans]
MAEFSVELTADLTLFGLRLIKASHGLTTYFPNVNGGGRSASVSPALRAQITELAFNAYEGLNVGQNFTVDKTAA